MPVFVYPKAEILFPSRLIAELKDLRGPEWQELVARVAELPETHPDSLAFSLMMIRLDGCLKCTNGSFKFMRGCLACARQTVMQFKGTDAELLRMYRRSLAEVNCYLSESEKLGQAA
ncbi:MAG: hypothetical protein RML36_05425 [Anaerolineae bacterium]|nr:hypothetical protein [Anaerolineae bacterium]MDW8098908.1 hypothetical protein [Anaerolineae bacterium]